MKKAKKEKLAVSAKAARILRKVAAHILEEPRRFNIFRWVEHVEPTKPSAPPCGTTACIAGWIHLLEAKRPQADLPRALSYEDSANRLLGRKRGDTCSLFRLMYWPERFHKGYAKASAGRRATIAARRIEHFIKTGE